MGFFSNNNIISYQRKEMERLERNLQKLAKGETDINCEVAPSDDSVRAEREAFVRLNQYILKIKGTMNDLAADVKSVSGNIKDGNISYKMDASKYSGVYSEIGKDINAAFEAVEEPMIDINNVLGKMAFNDFTLSMKTNYKGSFATTANEINDVQKRLLAVQNVAVKISQGDISELENYRKIGKRSENDHLVPALTEMMESIEGLINETTALERAAIQGNLGVRGQADKFKGEYVGIINGINKTLDSVVSPMREVKEAMSQIGVGNLKVSLKGNYNGEYEELINSVNITTGILNNVVVEISNILTEIAQGNLDITKIREFKGDFGIISESLNKIVNSLNEILGEINTAADQVAAGAEQVSGSSQILSQGSEEQASSIEEVTASITQMAAQVKQNAANAGEANQLSGISRENAVKGDEQMKAMLTAMEEINDSSSNISKIIKVIDDIAFQTNMLALNAAVEAARAGQYGKGFAVVAEEVKNLAERSASAAKEVTNMIENSIDKVGKGTRIANDTAKELVEIVKSITKASTLVGEITTASNEQTMAITQINQAVNQVSQVVQTNSATAEESASASEELSSQAEMLKNLVSKFRLRKNALPYGKMEELSPEVMSMLENMYRNKRTGGSFIEGRSEPESSKIKISLNDTEFDKY